jgi:alanine racemase
VSQSTGGPAPTEGVVRHASFDPWVELYATNLRHNVAEIRRRIAGRPILAVIKNNGYGAGVTQVARVLERLDGIAGLAVVKLQEAIALRDAGVRAPILLMGPFEGRELDELAARDITPMVYRPVAADLERVARARQQPVAVHVCVDTGIGRVGVPFRDADAYITDLAAKPFVRLAGTQMTFTEDPAYDVEQLRRFQALCE